jgi:methylmalonyl-CoA/ethylmalonyl-CoA epimerase
MKPHGVNRVTMIVRDLEQGKAFYSNLLGATFCAVHDAEAERFGIRCVIAWNAGIELVSPLPGRDSYARRFLEKHGEGLAGVVFAVKDVDEAKAAAEELGVRITYALDYGKDIIDAHLQGRFRKYKEYFLAADGPLSDGVLIGQFEPS